MTSPARILLALLLPLAAWSADTGSGVPDPFGLGERLALIDWLHERQVVVPEGAELEALRGLYRSAIDPQPIATGQDPTREAAALELWRKHSRNPEPGEDAASILKRIADLDAAAAADQRRDAADDDRPRGSAPAVAAARAVEAKPIPLPEPKRAAQAKATTAPAHALAEVREIARPKDMGDRVRAFLISPDASPILVVVCDPDLMGMMETSLARWPASERLAAGIDGTVIIHGHSDGGYFNRGVLKDAGAVGSDLAEHLRRNREYYETMAGTRSRKNIDFAVMTGCNAGGFNQEVELRDGLGYRPVHRVFTAPESYDAGVVVLPAIIATGSRAWDRTAPYRVKFTWHEKIAGHVGNARTVACYGVVDEDALDIKDHLRRFLVSPDGIHEETSP